MTPTPKETKENINVGSQIISTNENWVCNNWRAK